ncbi:GPI ethanolamine phosphate transferase 3 [Trichoplax sp. H2]|nr:GPI ethanolamine phosphate transferase 3 [Trichoplax sp. H2]|eukprot:RDD40694.1 GPI ethanolamine phosphate transferase 3 [Trichoplax sp. H2]
MHYRWNLVLTVVWLWLLYVAGIHIFTKGFLLRRMEIANKSHCSQPWRFNTAIQSLYQSNKEKDTCTIPAQYHRAILIIIDALRFDFVKYDENWMGQSYYRNKLKIIHELMTTRPNQSRLYQFMADPPTTTMQRIKGLTTGSLPTFVDAGSNFQSSQISEDNFIHQLRQLNKTIVFMGDDTWEGLYPNVFHRSHPFPSFNVKDLHSVDNGVVKHLMPEMHRHDWSVLIAHFLGVDHCGHTYGPNHPEMSNKLIQMDTILRKIIANIDNDTILLIMGDHGMTRTGDHGGDSDAEITAALFVYSGRPINNGRPDKGWKTISQADLVPTISLLLGLPIPFANLGLVADELFTITNDSLINMYHRIEMLRINAWQVNTYLKTYSKLANDFLGPISLQLEEEYTALEANYWKNLNSHDLSLNSEQLSNIHRAYQSYLRNVREICASVWAKFDMITICFGLLILMIAIISTLMILQRQRNLKESVLVQLEVDSTINWNIKLAYRVWFLTLVTLVLATYFLHWLDISYVLSIVVFISALASAVSCFYTNTGRLDDYFIIWVNLLYSTECESMLIGCCFIFHSLSYFSNSFVVMEDNITRFFVQTCAIVYIFKLFKNTAKNVKKGEKNANGLKNMLLLGLAWMCGNRIASSFYSCREEQYWCAPSNLLNSPTGIHWSYKSLSFASVLIVSVLLILTIHQDNLKFTTFGKLLKWSTPICSICIIGYWLILSLPESILKSLLPWQHVILPRIVYAVVIITVITLLSKSMMKTIAKVNLSKGLQLDKLEITMKLLLLTLSLPLMMLLGCGLAPSLLLCLFGITCFLALSNFCRLLSMQDNSGSVMSCWTQILTWEILCSQSYFITGHQNAIITIRWAAAFTGLHGDSNSYALLGLLVLLNTYAAQIIFGLCVTLLVPMIRYPELWKKYRKGVNREIICYSSFFEIIVYFILFCGIKVFSAAIAAAVLRRHLMAWKIFAPRLLFEVSSFIITSLSALVGYLIGYRFVSLHEDDKCNIRSS